MRWSPASRIIGFEGRGDQKKVCWVMCEGIPVCLAVERIRPANNDQLLAYHCLHKHCDLLRKEEQLSYAKLQRSEQPTIVKRKREPDDDTDSEMLELESSEAEEQPEESEEEEESDDDEEESEREVEQQEPTTAPKRSQEHDPYEGRSPKRPARIEQIEEPIESQIKSRERTDRSHSPVKTRSPTKNWEQDLEHDPDHESLLDTWNRTGTTGRGKEILEREEAVSDALLAFLGTRTPKLPRVKKFSTKNEKKEKRGKTLSYERESKEIREGFDVSRKEEWNKWKKFTAGRPIRGKELKDLLSQGHVPIPTDGLMLTE